MINSCCYYFVCTFDSTRNKLKTFVGDDCLKQMITELYGLSDKCIEEMRENKRMVMTDNDKINFTKAKTCCLCNETFNESHKKLCKVRDHDHATGKYRGAALCKCNIDFLVIDIYQ